VAGCHQDLTRRVLCGVFGGKIGHVRFGFSRSDGLDSGGLVAWEHGNLSPFTFILRNRLESFLLEKRWPLTRAAMVFIAVLLPFDPFVIDKRLKYYEP